MDHEFPIEVAHGVTNISAASFCNFFYHRSLLHLQENHQGPYGMLCVIWYHQGNSKNVKNTYGRVLLLVKSQVPACNFTKSNTPPWLFLIFFKLHKQYQIAQSVTYQATQCSGFWFHLVQKLQHTPSNNLNVSFYNLHFGQTVLVRTLLEQGASPSSTDQIRINKEKKIE